MVIRKPLLAIVLAVLFVTSIAGSYWWGYRYGHAIGSVERYGDNIRYNVLEAVLLLRANEQGLETLEAYVESKRRKLPGTIEELSELSKGPLASDAERLNDFNDAIAKARPYLKQ